MTEDTWYVADGEQRVGPLTLEVLLARGLDPDDLVWRPGLAEWTEVRRLPELRGSLAGVPRDLPGMPPATPVRHPGRVLFWFLLATLVVVPTLLVLLLANGPALALSAGALIGLLCLNYLGAVIGYLVFVHTTWRVLHAYGAEPGPWAATLYHLIPVFNLYWQLVALRRMAEYVNVVLRAHGGPTGRPLGLRLPTLAGVCLIAGWVVPFVRATTVAIIAGTPVRVAAQSTPGLALFNASLEVVSGLIWTAWLPLFLIFLYMVTSRLGALARSRKS